ncbi:hypothetical protein BH20ACT14_BH20ACT14_15990 [soil metagenome]
MTRLDPTLEEMAASLGPNATETDWSALHQAVEDRKLEAIRGDLRAERELPRLRPYPPLDLPNSTFKRFSPTRNRWPEIAEFDRRVDELERRQASVNDELDALKEQHRASALADRERLAAWVADENGQRPEPTAPATEKRIEELEANRDALVLAVLRLLDEKAAHVEKHRRRLGRDAAKATERAVERYKGLLSELEQARTEAMDARRAELWAALFPAELAIHDVGGALVLGGRTLRSVPWYISQTSAESVLTLLQADAEWIRNAQTADQRAEIEGTDPRHDPDTVWADSPEGAKVRERQSREARERIEAARWSGSRWEE